MNAQADLNIKEITLHMNRLRLIPVKLSAILVSVLLLIDGASVASAASTASVTLPVTVTVNANIAISVQPTTIDFGTIVPKGQVINTPLVINVTSDAAASVTFEVRVGRANLIDAWTASFAYGTLQLWQDPRYVPSGWGPEFALDGQPYAPIALVVGNNLFNTSINLTTPSQNVSAALGQHGMDLHILVRVT
ncbi:hypothetical protein AYI92_06685 [Shewanella xiamenensis]|uniref:hypothetical protein n=1 Tax=Shewanella xiamenensis TaxID=332186 RepID=UPI0011867371|nr:hypothetical protein [Shewanella xiamenensis]TVL21172.1 hypothetical protein AYI90_07070 [Shewanella xiamenensis]TVL21335.1 hypothetical protein AYI91_07800 [Shewanella xiamenensis]TVL27379.1 hypothetical protein AYI92_06685 [Shewanella xiamenensis]TVL34926.1 hypothetical protein AYI93_07300 [Shewanella xiamenensis]TVL35956.1 hypothetical protein AYI95_00330 [Shewanella xiamenensis]